MLEGRVLIIRRHIDSEKVPGPVAWSCAVYFCPNAIAEVHILHGTPGPTRKEIRLCARHIESFGYRVIWRRHKHAVRKLVTLKPERKKK
ncbi:hypothetical protein NTGM5_480006 [Candidatus Nitrotoga sp. M5]|nr:hypothetical protein NTGM5_480006 [Candidatus Nitrotoga sp. M5]